MVAYQREESLQDCDDALKSRKEMISKNNDGGRNYGGPGTIKSVDKDGTKVLEVVVYEDGRPDEDDEDDDYIKKNKKFIFVFVFLSP